jgi:tRNA (guanine-N7-)-methyltransferase
LSLLNPDDFVITRRRKKYKFAKFSNSPLCFELSQWKKQAVDCIEIGAGTAMFSVELAALQPNRQFVAVDVKADRLQKGAYEAEARGLTNVWFLRARADQLADCFKAKTISNIWITFPDPFPKKRSAGRRLTHQHFLALYKTLLARNGTLLFKTDEHALFDWSLEQLVRDGWGIQELSFDLHESELDASYKFLTTYEHRWLAEGKPTYFVRATPRFT